MWKALGVRKDVFYELLGLSLRPLIGALIYAAAKWFFTADTSYTILSFVGDLAAGFFFLMWLVGQYLRTQKSLDDSDRQDALQVGLEELNRSLQAISSRPNQDRQATVVATDNEMISIARKAVEDGHVLAGLMQAGVAFEQSIIDKGRRMGRVGRENTTAARILASFRDELGQATVNDLFAVWRLRNQLIHLDPDAAKKLENQPELIKSFEWAIKEIEDIGQRD